jgi:hypothetical protein
MIERLDGLAPLWDHWTKTFQPPRPTRDPATCPVCGRPGRSFAAEWQQAGRARLQHLYALRRLPRHRARLGSGSASAAAPRDHRRDPGRRRRRPGHDPVQGRAQGLQALDAPARARAAVIDRGQWPGIAPRSRHRARHIESRLSPGSGNGRVAARGSDETVVAVGEVWHGSLVMDLLSRRRAGIL